jgi:hypothetical protein
MTDAQTMIAPTAHTIPKRAIISRWLVASELKPMAVVKEVSPQATPR